MASFRWVAAVVLFVVINTLAQLWSKPLSSSSTRISSNLGHNLESADFFVASVSSSHSSPVLSPSCPFEVTPESVVTSVPTFSSLYNQSAESVYSHLRANPTPTKPDLCITFLSCRRYDLLARAMGSIVMHMETFYHRNISYEMSHFDNFQHPNCTSYVHREFVEKFHLNKHGSSFENHGISFGLNTLLFGFCR
eukprot:TRINITY_DN2513_c0_g1_i2.p1 TRINITY_DN2513_c0_g1~~TRINITY_DN2513_c0_g1_i2.p1  ORF type:complete len:194 (-),score=21.33 TRINITY_DN2513_c0_g1_i2:80-661(-)